MHIDLCKKEKDIENLTRQLQQQANYLSAGGHVPVSQKTNYLESFLVQQLKRQNRNMKVEVQEKDRLIEELKENVKVSKHREADNEIQTYIDECMRLRTLLEQTMIQNDAFATQQNNLAAAEDGVHEDQARLQEALYAQEAQLNQEREVKGNLQVAVMNEKEEKNRLLERVKLLDGKAKKHSEAVGEAKRKQKIISEKNVQIDHLQE